MVEATFAMSVHVTESFNFKWLYFMHLYNYLLLCLIKTAHFNSNYFAPYFFNPSSISFSTGVINSLDKLHIFSDLK